MFQKLPSHIFVYVSSFAVVTVINIITLSFFARTLGPEKYGIFGYLQGIFLFIASVISQGFIQSNVRFRSSYKEKGHYPEFIIYYQTTIIAVVLATIGILFLIISFVGDSLPKVIHHKYAILLLVSSSSMFMMLISLFQADLQPVKSAIFTIGRSFLRLFLPAAALFLITDDIEIFLYALAISELIVVGIILFELNKKYVLTTIRLTREDYFAFVKLFWFYGFPFVGWFLCSQIITYADRMILERYYSDYIVGTYISNTSLAVFVLSAVASPLMSAINPLLMSEIKSERVMSSNIENAITSATRFYLLLAGPLALVTFIFRKQLSLFVFGEKYAGASDVFGPILIGVVVWNMAMYIHKPLEVAQKTRKMFFALLVASILNIVSNIYLIPKYSFMGAAYSTMIGYTTYGIVITILLRESFIRIFPWQTALRLFIITAVLVLFNNYIQYVTASFTVIENILYGVFLIVFIFGFFFMLKEFSIDDIKSLWQKALSILKRIT